MANFQPIVFKINKELYGIDLMCVSAIEKDQQIVSVPNASSSIKGIINLRGEIIPVYSLRDKFKLPPMESDETNLIICNLDNMRLAVEVDAVEEINHIGDEQISAFPRIALNPETRFFTKVANVDGKLILIIDMNNLLTDEEEESAKQLMEE